MRCIILSVALIVYTEAGSHHWKSSEEFVRSSEELLTSSESISSKNSGNETLVAYVGYSSEEDSEYSKPFTSKNAQILNNNFPITGKPDQIILTLSLRVQ
uniref:Uncharacterized protein n=1 Tax=Timema genevievae TaxID=629358 RepID=A0A7R9JQ78_TIMGE|nr:unnamed protein product [Timema genevievae]